MVALPGACRRCVHDGVAEISGNYRWSARRISSYDDGSTKDAAFIAPLGSTFNDDFFNGLSFDFFGLYGSLSPERFWGGEQAAWWGPMAVAIICGLAFATVLTLVVTPAALAARVWIARLFAWIWRQRSATTRKRRGLRLENHMALTRASLSSFSSTCMIRRHGRP
mgnify:CR=1 FL=1